MKRLPWLFAGVLPWCAALHGGAQTTPHGRGDVQLSRPLAELNLPRNVSLKVQSALLRHDYIAAEKLLLPLLNERDAPLSKARLLDFLGSVYFQEGDALQAAIAWKQADALTPLPPPLRFSLAMAYVHLRRPDWARTELKRLAAQQPTDAEYPYWLGRLAYDGHLYDEAIQYFEAAIALNDSMAKAHDSLGLALFYLNRNQEAELQFRRAIALEQPSGATSAWSHLNLALVLKFTNRLDAAVTELEAAITANPALAQAYYELGTAREQQGKLPQAVEALRHAVALDASYPEPHAALARLLRRTGQHEESQREVVLFQRLRAEKAGEAPAQSSASPTTPR